MAAAEPIETQATYAEMFRGTVDRLPDRLALVFPRMRLTYRELLDRAEGRAGQLLTLGVGRGDRFGLLMENGPEAVEFLLAGALVGATAVPINTRFKPRELAHVIADAELASVITTGGVAGVIDFADLLLSTVEGLGAAEDPSALALAQFPRLRTIASSATEEARPGIVTLPDRSADDGRPLKRQPPFGSEEPFLMMYTSGTTANPKGCVFTTGAIAQNAMAIVDRLEIPADDVWWDPLPMFHMGGLMLMSSVFAAGATFISQPHFTPEEALDLIEAEHPTVLYPLFPTITLDVIHHERFASAVIDGVRLLGSVAPPDVQRRIQDAFPSARVFSAYGITELCGCVAFHSPGDSSERRLSGCGRALEGFQMRIVDPDSGQPLPSGGRGELVGRGPQMFTGYYGNPEATAAVMDGEGFFHTGDLCSMDEIGEISYHGRIKDMLKVGGENVSAIEVESFLATHPAIKMAQVVGVPDLRLLEVGAAFVELAPGESLTAEAVVDYCRGKIASFKVPRYVRFVSEWPMSATKVQKFRLRDELLSELRSDGPAALEASAG
jgi:fatty-acyl-CoA synthase